MARLYQAAKELKGIDGRGASSVACFGGACWIKG